MSVRRSSQRRRAGRVSRFEPFEPRLFLSGDPVADFSVDYIVESQPPCVFGDTDEIRAFSERLADAHELTGLDQVLGDFDLTGRGQTVAVIDSGIAYSHVALGGGYGPGYRVVGGFDFTEERDGDPYDDGPFGSHGTHIAGIIGSTDNSYPGVAPGADLVALRVFNDQGWGSFSWVEEALLWVHDHRFSFENPITTVNLSLGAAWNDDVVPDWAILEDELALLEADGIFIAAAAGNDFVDQGEPGLAYPAASEHVVAVGAVDGDGGLSYFSQRDPRAILAPGRAIRSTVPDYLGDGNGVDDDFARYSGTSMAAPYVAAASTLLREAYGLVGVANVSQDMLYNVMYDTADVLRDPQTGLAYHRLNLQRAVEFVLPADDPQPVPVPPDDPPQQPHDPPTPEYTDWGVVGQGHFDDYRLDSEGLWFRMAAAADGTLTTEAIFSHADGDVDIELFDADHQLVGTSQGMGDLERIDVAASAGDTFYLHAFVYGGGTTDQVDFRVTNLVSQDGGTVRVSGTAGDDQFVFAAGRTYQLTVNGVYYEFDAALVDRVVIDGVAGSDTAVLSGTDGNDRAVLRPGSAELTGPGYRVLTGAVENHTIRAGAGLDRAVLHDSAADDKFVATTEHATLSSNGFDNRVEGFEVVIAQATAGGNDAAELFDSAGNDQFIATPQSGALYGRGFFNQARSFQRIRAHATAGGNDVAKLFDSAGDDRFVATASYGVLQGKGFSNRAEYFDAVHAYATGGGNDTAVLHASDAKDVFIDKARSGALRGRGFYNRAKFFEQLDLLKVAVERGPGGGSAARLSAEGSARVDRVLAEDAPRAETDRTPELRGAAVEWLCRLDSVRRESGDDDSHRAKAAAVDYLLELDLTPLVA